MRKPLLLAVVLVTMFLGILPQQAEAADPVAPPIWDLKVALGTEPGNAQCGPGWTRIESELDKGAGGLYVYLCVSYEQKNYSTPIGGMVVCEGICEEDGYTFRVVSTPIHFPGYLNTGGGDWLEFGYFRSSIEPLTAVKFVTVVDDTWSDLEEPIYKEINANGINIDSGQLCNNGFVPWPETLWHPMLGIQDLNRGSGQNTPFIFGCEQHQVPIGHVASRPLYGFAVAVDQYEYYAQRLTRVACPVGWQTVSPMVRRGNYGFGEAHACITRDPSAPGASPNPITFIGLTEDREGCGRIGGIIVNGGYNFGNTGELDDIDDEDDVFYGFCVSRLHSPQSPNIVVDGFAIVEFPNGPPDPEVEACHIKLGPDWENAWLVSDDQNSVQGLDWWDDSYACVHYALEYDASRFDPLIRAPGQLSVDATFRVAPGVTAAAVNFEVSAVDAFGQPVDVSCTHASGDIFNVGTTRVDCTATDEVGAPGRTSRASFNVIVTDPPPGLSGPQLLDLEATSANGATGTFSVTAVDAIDGTRPVTCQPPSGSVFPINSTISGTEVQCTATDADGHTGSLMVRVSVRDTTPPSITAPPDVYVQNTGFGETVSEAQLGTPAASDAVGVALIARQPAGNLFPGGTTTVTWTATDTRGNTANATQRVTVGNAPAPAATPPADVTVEAQNPGGAFVSPAQLGMPSSSGPIASITRVPAGNNFPIGTTTINWVVTSTLGGIAYVQQQVRIVDSTAPVIIGPASVTLDAQNASGATFGLSALGFHATDAIGVVSLTPVPAGPQFPLGTTQVLWSARDAVGNVGTFTLTVNVLDRLAPIIDAIPPTVTVEATGPLGAIVSDATLGALVARDNVGPVTITRLPATNQFSLGDTTIRWRATDASSNTTEATQLVRVVDTTAPALTLASTLTVEATDANGAVVNYPATASDLIDGLVAASCAPASGTRFPFGGTAVQCSAADSQGNTVQGALTVQVVDTTAPTITAPPDVRLEAEDAGGASLDPGAVGQAEANDAVGPVQIAMTAVPRQFPLGETVITWSARDGAGNTATATQRILVVDSTAPVLTLPGVVEVEAASTAGAQVTYDASALDAVDGVVAVSCSINSGALVPPGRTDVSCSARDSRGNSASGTFTLSVLDRMPPVIDAVSDLLIEATGQATTASFVVVGRDAIDGEVAATCVPASASMFPVGSTTVSCTAMDAAGNTSAPVQFSVIVRDTTAPSLVAPAAVTIEATGAQGAFVSDAELGQPMGTDAVGPVTIVHSGGNQFPLGSTIVIWTATDGAGNSATATQLVTVQDTTAPTIDAPADVVVNATSENGASIAGATLGVATAQDLVGSVTVRRSPEGSLFGIGVTVVTWSARDASGNTATAQQQVTVRDVTTPGRMHGNGFIVDAAARYQFNLLVAERPTAGERGRFELRVNSDESAGRRGRDQRGDRFVATDVTYIAFGDDPTYRAGRSRRVNVDTVLFSGQGTWNGQANYRFEVFASDQGEPGRHVESVRITITDPSGAIVAHVEGPIAGGNVQSSRIRH